MKKFFVLLMMSWPVISAFSQISISGQFESDTILLGDQVTFNLVLKVERGVHITRIETNFIDSITSVFKSYSQSQDSTAEVKDIPGDYVIHSYGKWTRDPGLDYLDSGDISFDSVSDNSFQYLQNSFEIQFWDPGMHVLKLPAISFTYNGQPDEYSSSEFVVVYVKPPYEEEIMSSDSLQIAPIKSILKEKLEISDYLNYILIASAIVLIGIAFWLWNKFKKKENIPDVKKVVPQIPAHQLALEKLYDLSEKKLWQKGEIKEYQSELTYIVREYMEKRYEIHALESTTDEILNELKNKNFDKELESTLREILQIADLVKFAKAKPALSIHEQFLNSAVGFVKSTSEESETAV